jgi:hypothetical protein
MKLYILLFLLLNSPGLLNAQHLKVSEARLNSWSGGLAGRSGKTYDFKIENIKNAKHIKLDSIWVDERCFLLSTGSGPNYENYRTEEINNKKIFNIKIGIDTSTFDYSTGRTIDVFKEKCPAPRKGQAVISYYFRGRKYYLEVKEINIEAHHNYP